MGLYSHYTTDQLTAMRDRLSVAFEQRLTGPASAAGHGRSVQFQQDGGKQLQQQIIAINEELQRRAGGGTRRPIYLV